MIYKCRNCGSKVASKYSGCTNCNTSANFINPHPLAYVGSEGPSNDNNQQEINSEPDRSLEFGGGSFGGGGAGGAHLKAIRQAAVIPVQVLAINF